jgi:subtilisin family serine protease
VQNGFVAIEGVAAEARALKDILAAIGAQDVRGDILFSARVPVRELARLGADPALRSAAPVMARTRALPTPAVSQGVQSLFGLGGNTTPFDGTGVRVGALSDSFGCEPGPFLPGAPTSTVSEDQMNGELPSDIVVADDACPGNTDEGRAMMQLIYDVAPGASQAFHTAFNSRFDFACGILELGGIDTAGAAFACGSGLFPTNTPYSPLMGGEVSNVIVDDVIYFEEPMFMPGAVAQAVNTVYGAGIPYFSSAGNEERLSYEAVYDEIIDHGNFGRNLNRGAAPGPNAIRVHEFDGDGDTAQTIRLTQSGGASFVVLSFQWDQPHFSSTAFNTLLAGGTLEDALAAPFATTDMDILFYDDKGILVPLCPPGVAAGITCQITGSNNVATGDAVDLVALFFTGPKPQGDFQIRIVRSGGSEDVGRVKYVAFELQGTTAIVEHDTRSGTSFGHANAAGAASIGAAAWYATVEWKDNPADERGLFLEGGSPRCDPACAEDFSSAGGVPIFFDALGNPLPMTVRENPWVTGPDGGNTTFFFSDSSFDDDDGDMLNNPFSSFLTPPDPDPASEYPNFFGTSGSAPHVAAVAGLMLEKDPDLSPDEVYDILKTTAEDMALRTTNMATPDGPVVLVYPIDDPDPEGFDYDTGWGFVYAVAAVGAVP